MLIDFLIKYSQLLKCNTFFRSGLCNESINQTPGDMPPPTVDDLQGFWEMVLLQVENVDSLYADLDKIRANGWKVSNRIIFVD